MTSDTPIVPLANDASASCRAKAPFDRFAMNVSRNTTTRKRANAKTLARRVAASMSAARRRTSPRVASASDSNSVINAAANGNSAATNSAICGTVPTTKKKTSPEANSDSAVFVTATTGRVAA